MKKKLISLILITCLFSFVGVAKASDLDEGQSLTISESGEIGGLSYTSPLYYSDSYTTHQYSATGANGTYDAFCIDPHGVSTKGSGFIVTPVSDQRFAAAVSAILSSNADYLSKRTALVTFIYGVGNFAGMTGDIANLDSFTYSGKPVPYSSSFTNAGIEWACQNSSTTSQLVSFSGDCNSSLKSMAQSRYTNYDPNASLSGSTSGAYSLFVNALNAAANAGSGDSESESMTLNATLNDTQVNEDSVVITANFDITDMSANGYLRNINFTLDGSGYGEPTLEYSVNGGEFQSLTNASDTNLAESLVEGLGEGETASGTITLRITLSKNASDDEECTPASFTITYDYTGVSNYKIAILKGGKNTGLGPSQNYIAYFATGEEQETENSGTLTGEIPCEEGEEVCGTYITTPICSDNEEESTSDIVAPEDIKKCILDNEDDAGNTYQLDYDYGGLKDNDYCDVFCKEDYKDVLNSGEFAHGIILQPKIDDVVCGGYFQLKAHIEGAKDCYTGGDGTENSENGLKSIDKEKYLEEIQRIENNMVDALTRYNEAVKTLEQLEAAEKTEETFTCGNQTVTNVTITTESTEYTGFTFEWNEEDESGSFEEVTGTTEVPPFSDNQTCVYDEETDTYSVEGEAEAESDYQKKISDVQDNRDSAKADYDQAVKEYRENISMYNECVTGWTMTYDFAHTLRYYYDETYEQDGQYESTIPYYDLIKDNADNTVMVPDEEDGVYEYLVDVEVCKETATNEYECEGDSVTYDNFDEDDVGQTNIITESDVIGSYAYGYDNRYADIFEEKNYVLCKIDGDGEGICDNDTRNISQASFVRKSIKKAQDYISPSVFWQSEVSGKITASEVEGTESLEHKLPVSSRSVLGGTFRLILEDFGEFYADPENGGKRIDNYGRLIDYNGNNESDSVANALGYDANNGFDGNYECYYVNNCKPDDCPNCDFDGTEIPDCPNCDFTGSEICLNCIFNWDELQINVKPISPSEVINPSRDYGYNWNVNTEFGRLELISQKAEQTINEITEQNDLIYSSTKYTDENGLAFSINLTPSIISYLKEYNALHDGGGDDKGDGGYANDSLTCEDAQFGKTTVKNLFCKSEVIDYLLEDEEYRKQIPNVDEFEEKRSDVNSYWTTFPNWEQIVGDELTDAGQNYVIGGPAWK